MNESHKLSKPSSLGPPHANSCGETGFNKTGEADEPKGEKLQWMGQNRRLSHKDNWDILYSFIWGHLENRRFHGGYSKYSWKKWEEVKGDRNISPKFLVTKGKRLYTRAFNEIQSGPEWLTKADLDQIERLVTNDFQKVYPTDSNGTKEEVSNLNEESPLTQPDLSQEDSQNNKRRLESEEFLEVRGCAFAKFHELKEKSIENQERCRMPKSRLGKEKEEWIDFIASNILSTCSDSEKEDISIINTVIYATGLAFNQSKEPQDIGKRKSYRGKPEWRLRLEKKVLMFR